MQPLNVSRDDLMDIAEMMKKIEDSIIDTLDGNAANLGMSALMSATINCIMRQCTTVQEAKIYRQIYMSIFDDAISSMQIDDKN